jgi:hypothetical protein
MSSRLIVDQTAGNLSSIISMIRIVVDQEMEENNEDSHDHLMPEPGIILHPWLWFPRLIDRSIDMV